jgi:hypothetical protein
MYTRTHRGYDHIRLPLESKPSVLFSGPKPAFFHSGNKPCYFPPESKIVRSHLNLSVLYEKCGDRKIFKRAYIILLPFMTIAMRGFAAPTKEEKCNKS